MNQEFMKIIFVIIGIIFYLVLDNDSDESNYLANKIRAKLRRNKVLKKCKNFLIKKDKSLTLKNKHVMLVFDTEKKTMLCVNIKNLKQTAFVEWEKQLNFVWSGKADNKFERIFDSICLSFNENSTYSSLLKVLNTEFISVKLTCQDTKNETKTEKIKNIEPNTNLININDASAEQLAKLPGINIVLAKKIIKRTNLKGNFESIEQMFTEMKIKKHFQIQLKNFICAKPVEKETKQKTNNDRIIDF